MGIGDRDIAPLRRDLEVFGEGDGIHRQKQDREQDQETAQRSHFERGFGIIGDGVILGICCCDWHMEMNGLFLRAHFPGWI
jgi:hypothetical protein